MFHLEKSYNDKMNLIDWRTYMNILIIDAQGGGIGKQLVSEIKHTMPSAKIIAVGSNTMATSQMLKAGADIGATGENPVVVNCRTADVILGPVGIVIADAMYGEITPTMAAAVGQSAAEKILIPINHCSNYIVGVGNQSMKILIQEAVEKLKELCQ